MLSVLGVTNSIKLPEDRVLVFVFVPVPVPVPFLVLVLGFRPRACVVSLSSTVTTVSQL